MAKKIDQVALSELVFTLNWEDPKSDLKALRIQPRSTIVSITSGGCNTIEFLLHGPDKIYAIDINPAQNFLMELKKAAFHKLNYREFACLMGLNDSEDPWLVYNKLKDGLSSPALNFWNANRPLIAGGILLKGRYEKFVSIAGKAINFIQGKRRVRGLFAEKSLEEQQRYYDEVFDTWRFKMIFRLLFNKQMLARRGLNADYFHFDDGSSSFAESFYQRARNAFRNIPIENNYFLALYLLGRYLKEDAVPEYLKEEHFDMLKARVHRIEAVTEDAKTWLQSMPDQSVDGFALSNICELKSEEDTAALFKEVARVGKEGAGVCFRNLMIPRGVPEPLKDIIQKDETLSQQIIKEDRSFVYGKVAAYTIRK